MISIPTGLRQLAILLFVVAVVLYGLFQARDLIRGPVIVIETPKNGETLKQALVDIKGTAQNISNITLNDRHIFVDEDGNFTEQLLLGHGYTIMTFEASDRFGRETKETLELVYQ